MDKFGVFVMPCTVCITIIFGLVRKVPVFDTFVAGAKEGIRSCISILPSLIGLMMAVTMLSASGALDMFSAFLAPAANAIGIPAQTMPLALLRPISGSGSLAILTNIFSNNGPDSFVGRVASVMMGSTETTFYAIAVYFGSVGIKKTRHTIPAALSADFTGYIASALAVLLFFQ